MLRFELTLPIPYTDSQLKSAIAKKAKVDITSVLSYTILSRSIDARKKNSIGIRYVISLLASIVDEDKVAKRLGIEVVSLPKVYEVALPKTPRVDSHVIVIGSGPAGLMSALALSRSGVKVTILERGESVDDRVRSIDNFVATGKLNTNSNIQFGEGGAGTFSDGKLTTGIKNPRISYVVQALIDAGAPDNIRYESKPHIGTDILRQVVKNIRRQLIDLGARVIFSATVEDIIVDNGRARGVVYREGECTHTLYADAIVLAIGHSARDTYRRLRDIGVYMEKKSFSIGVRIEHRREDINLSQYGREDVTADYKLATHLDNGRGVYTFCMCPGGEVVPATSEEGSVVVNGMSNSKRDNINSNSAILVSVTPLDFEGEDVLAGVEFQQKYERLAYECTGSYLAPCQTVGNMLYSLPNEIGKVKPTYPLGVKMKDLREILPEYVYDSIKQAILVFDHKLKGFADKDAILTGVETRSSAPIRIIRDESGQSNIRALYPCGEGAGYAGGIMSASVDGVMIAEEILSSEYI